MQGPWGRSSAPCSDHGWSSSIPGREPGKQRGDPSPSRRAQQRPRPPTGQPRAVPESRRAGGRGEARGAHTAPGQAPLGGSLLPAQKFLLCPQVIFQLATSGLWLCSVAMSCMFSARSTQDQRLQTSGRAPHLPGGHEATWCPELQPRGGGSWRGAGTGSRTTGCPPGRPPRPRPCPQSPEWTCSLTAGWASRTEPTLRDRQTHRHRPVPSVDPLGPPGPQRVSDSSQRPVQTGDQCPRRRVAPGPTQRRRVRRPRNRSCGSVGGTCLGPRPSAGTHTTSGGHHGPSGVSAVLGGTSVRPRLIPPPRDASEHRPRRRS